MTFTVQIRIALKQNFGVISTLGKSGQNTAAVATGISAAALCTALIALLVCVIATSVFLLRTGVGAAGLIAF